MAVEIGDPATHDLRQRSHQDVTAAGVGMRNNLGVSYSVSGRDCNLPGTETAV